MTTQFGTFFLPGPTEVRPDVLAAMTRPMIPHRGKAFEQLFARLQEGLRGIFVTTRPVLVSSSSATGLMEASLRCVPEGAVLSLVNGAFSERYAQIAAACGHPTDRYDVALGETFDLDEVARRLGSRSYVAVTVVHSETSTGVLTDVRTVTQIARKHGTLCLVDSVTGVAGAELRFDEWEMDFVLTGSQKALALPPGLAVGVASEEYMRRAPRAPVRGLYFDLVEFEQFALKNQTPNTPALPLLYALDAQLAAMAVEGGIEARWARHSAMAELTWRWAEALGEGFGVLAPGGSRSPTVTAITLPNGLRGGAVAEAVAKRGYVVGSGYGKLKDRTFRIGHMGDHTPDGLARCLEICTEAMQAVNVMV